MADLLKIKNLKVDYIQDNKIISAVRGIDLELGRRQTLAIVGESGCGKSTTALAITRLIPERCSKVYADLIEFDYQNILALNKKQLCKIRGGKISYVFQEPASSLNPVFTIGEQIKEAIKLHCKMDKKQAQKYAIDMLKKVGIPSAEKRFYSYPHQLSGGMKQRVMIAMALVSNPKLLIADEPTTALDVTIQVQILKLLDQLKKNSGLSIIMISHDLRIVKRIADYIAIMYAGVIVEYGTKKEVFNNPSHPYTRALLECMPDRKSFDKQENEYKFTDKYLSVIPGKVADCINLPEGCAFHPRCSNAQNICVEQEPDMYKVTETHKVRCCYCL